MFRLPTSLLSALTAPLLLNGMKTITMCEAHDDVKFGTDSKDSIKDFVGVFLNQKSKDILRRYLEKLGDGGMADSVVVKSVIDADDIYTFDPIMGERVVFRLKGLCKVGNATSGYGKLTTLVGDIQLEGYTPSLPVDSLNDKNIFDLRKSMDLPTRFKNSGVLGNKDVWKGKLNPTTVLGAHYPSESGTLSTFPWNKQIVLEGRLCLKSTMEDDGNCNYKSMIKSDSTTSRMEGIEDKKKKDITTNSNISNKDNVNRPQIDNDIQEENNTTITTTTTPTADSTTTTAEESDECPVCQYMKGGPCKPEFLNWDSCIQGLTKQDELSKCMKQTLEMMGCMRKYEYYDIMTAGVDHDLTLNDMNKSDT